jgi:hypothetical protein
MRLKRREAIRQHNTDMKADYEARVATPAPPRKDGYRRVVRFRLIFSTSEAVNDVHDNEILNVVESLSVVIYDVD